MKSRRNKGPKTNTGVSYKKNKGLERQKNSANYSKNKLSWQKNAHRRSLINKVCHRTGRAALLRLTTHPLFSSVTQQN